MKSEMYKPKTVAGVYFLVALKNLSRICGFLIAPLIVADLWTGATVTSFILFVCLTIRFGQEMVDSARKVRAGMRKDRDD